jgi:hypothetical protein
MVLVQHNIHPIVDEEAFFGRHHCGSVTRDLETGTGIDDVDAIQR